MSTANLNKLLGDNASVLSESELKSAQKLVDAGQEHLFKTWPAKGTDDTGKKTLMAQVEALDAALAPAGIKGYSTRARALLASSKRGDNPYEGYVPEVPAVETCETKSKEGKAKFDELEALGVSEAAKACFVLVAGGLGERLGYNGIKIALPSETTTGLPYAGLYIQSILALQSRARKATGDASVTLPLAIMTSGDTDGRTRALLEEHKNFGMEDGQITIMKQEKVPSLADNNGAFVYGDGLSLQTKPHGHGDVHTLLYQTKLSEKWAKEGKKWILFFQDTNGLVFKAVPAMLGASAQNKFEVNSLTIPRVPGEAVGAICRLESKTKTAMTINVEYNQLDALMKASGKKDEKNETGYSPFPGNTNVLLFEAQSFAKTLEKSQGVISEFVNPKYKDAEKTIFKKPTRLECMMQDYPKLLESSSIVGATQCERWFCFSAVKNNVADAAGKQAQTGFPESGASGEADIYWANRQVLAFAGTDVSVDGKIEEFSGIKVKVGAKVVLTPSFAVTQGEVAAKVTGEKVKISNSSSLVLDGAGIVVKSLELDGALSIQACEGASVTVDGLVVKNKGRPFVPTNGDEDEKFLIRGYTCPAGEETVLVANEPGNYTVGADGKLVKQ
jgi:UDP-sugar pyrophosphorylase